jgi:hypothetical protein
MSVGEKRYPMDKKKHSDLGDPWVKRDILWMKKEMDEKRHLSQIIMWTKKDFLWMKKDIALSNEEIRRGSA